MQETALDNIKVGDFIVVYDFKNWRPPEFSYKPPGCFDGEALYVEAVDLPFVAVSDGKKISAIDTRVYEIRRVTDDYAGAWGFKKGRKWKNALRWARRQGKNARNQQTIQDGYPRCVKCGSRFSRVLRQDDVWCYKCPDCLNDGGPIPKEDQ